MHALINLDIHSKTNQISPLPPLPPYIKKEKKDTIDVSLLKVSNGFYSENG